MNETPTSSAEISECGLYRYTLTRRLSGIGRVNFIMLNPSTADASLDDPTIRRCIGFTRKWEMGEMIVTNLFALRATDPSAIKAADDPIGPLNDDRIRAVAMASDFIVAAWGAHGSFRARDAAVLDILSGVPRLVMSLSTTKSGHPGHPLYLPADSYLTPYRRPEKEAKP